MTSTSSPVVRSLQIFLPATGSRGSPEPISLEYSVQNGRLDTSAITVYNDTWATSGITASNDNPWQVILSGRIYELLGIATQNPTLEGVSNVTLAKIASEHQQRMIRQFPGGKDSLISYLSGKILPAVSAETGALAVDSTRDWLNQLSEFERVATGVDHTIVKALVTENIDFPYKVNNLPSLARLEAKLDKDGSSAEADGHFLFLDAISKLEAQEQPPALQALVHFVIDSPGLTYKPYTGSLYAAR